MFTQMRTRQQPENLEVSFTFFKRWIKERQIEEWNEYYQNRRFGATYYGTPLNKPQAAL